MGLFDAIASIGKKSGDWFAGAGRKVGHWATHLGSKGTYQDIASQFGKGLDYGIQGLKTATSTIDKTPYLGYAMSWVPFEQAVVRGVDLADHLRKVAKGESKFSFGKLAEDVILGGMSALGGKAELEGFKQAGQWLGKANFLSGSLRKAIPLSEAIGGAGKSILQGQLGEDLGGWVAGKVGKTYSGLGKASEWGSTISRGVGSSGVDAGVGVAQDVGKKSLGQLASFVLS